MKSTHKAIDEHHLALAKVYNASTGEKVNEAYKSRKMTFEGERGSDRERER